MPPRLRVRRIAAIDLPSIGIQMAGIILIAGFVVVLQIVAARNDYSVWRGLVFIPALVLVTIPLLAWAGRLDPDPRFLGLLTAAFTLKFLGTAARYLLTMVLYEGESDAGVYHGHGARLSTSYRHGDFSADLEMERFVGTGFVRALTGVLYAVTGPSLYVGFAVFTWLGFWGLYFFYRAFQTAIPDGDHRRYALLVFFLPTMLYWPSSLGKDAWMTLGIGLTAFGAAKLLVGAWGWVLPLAAGLGATALVRPHITVMLCAGITAALVLRRSLRQASVLAPLVRGVVTAAAVALTMLLAGQAASFLGIEDLSGESVKSVTTDVGRNTSQGGSEFTAASVDSPLDFPWAAVTVLFRPFLFEVNSAQMLIAGLEGMFLIVLAVRAIPRLRGIGSRLRAQSYLIFCVVYISLFVYAFSSVGNFGILARQRVQVLPLMLVFLALPLLRRKEEPPPEESESAQPAPRKAIPR
jgi:hypothetical protein